MHTGSDVKVCGGGGWLTVILVFYFGPNIFPLIWVLDLDQAEQLVICVCASDVSNAPPFVVDKEEKW